MRMRTALAGLAAVTLAVLAAPSAATVPPGPTLEGESFFIQADALTIEAADCNTEGVSTARWSSAGPALGPYPGTFVAGGTVTIAPQTLPGGHPPGANREGTVAGRLLDFQESFTISSGATTINGTKRLLYPDQGPEAGTIGTCQQVSRFPILDFFDGQGRIVEIFAQLHYEATISGPSGTFADSGLAFYVLSDLDITGSCPTGTCHARLGGLSQNFALSDQPASTPGRASGGGQVSSVGTDRVTFAFHARNGDAGMTGMCNIVDHLAGRRIRCDTVDSYVQAGTHVSIEGEAHDGGVATTYLIEADDNGEPNHGADTFTIETGTGYIAGGNVTNGNVQVR